MVDNASIRSEIIADGVMLLTLDRAEERNAIAGAQMINDLHTSLSAANDDRRVRAVVLTGAGTAFSAGGNLKKIGETLSSQAASPCETRDYYRAGIQRLPLLFERLDVPVIAAVNGAAIGAGCDLACMCDIRVAAASAFFAESFVTLGLIPGDGGAWLLPRVVGFAKASEMALTGARVPADEALACGLVSRVVPDGELMVAALDVAKAIARNPPIAVRMTRRLLRETQRSSLETALELSAALQSLAHATEDHREAIAAFLAKRPAVFQGR